MKKGASHGYLLLINRLRAHLVGKNFDPWACRSSAKIKKNLVIFRKRALAHGWSGVALGAAASRTRGTCALRPRAAGSWRSRSLARLKRSNRSKESSILLEHWMCFNFISSSWHSEADNAKLSEMPHLQHQLQLQLHLAPHVRPVHPVQNTKGTKKKMTCHWRKLEKNSDYDKSEVEYFFGRLDIFLETPSMV